MRATEFTALNDKVEFTYGMKQVMGPALKQALAAIPDDLLDSSKVKGSIQKFADEFEIAIKHNAATSDGYGSLYVCSFARGRSADEEKRGILTLWGRYTGLSGYCLQFREDDVNRIVDLEQTRFSYEYITVADVRYGTEQSGAELASLSEQAKLRLLKMAYDATRDARLAPDISKHWVDSVFAQKLMLFCASHKDPAFLDEREKRILAFPARMTTAQPFTGVAHVKPIRNRPDGVRFLGLAEAMEPGFIPIRIMTAPNATLEQAAIKTLYPGALVEPCDIPIR